MDVKLQILLNILEEVSKKYDEIVEIKEELLKEAEYKSTHDLLTGVYNRSFFKKKINELIKNNTPFSVAFIDLDNFKYVNDTFGHNKGDEILIKTAKILRSNLKGKDIIARFGGDEFVVAITDCDEECSKQILENIQKEINFVFREYKVTASIGISSYPQLNDYHQLIKIADKKMYEAKKNGKNKIR